MSRPPAVRALGVSAWYHQVQALQDVSLTCEPGRITALIGPTASGKSTLLRLVNRLAEESDGFRRAGRLFFDELDVFALPDPVPLRRRVALLPEEPALFRGSVFDNLAFGPRVSGIRDAHEIRRRVEEALREVGLWLELETQLDASPTQLPLGKQQRLCLARALALDPDVVLLDRATARLDPVATAALEEVVLGFRDRRTVLMVAADQAQAGRLADITAFLDKGVLVEVAPTAELFTRPRNPETEAYLSRRYADRG